MKVLVVATMTNNFGKKGSYNSQEIGLARGFTKLGHEVIIYKTVKTKEEAGTDVVDDHAVIHYIKCKFIGSNGYLPVSMLDSTADLLVQFSDVQLSVPGVYKWCCKNQVRYIPYVGITWSQSNNFLVKVFIEMMARRNFRIYRKNGCIAKNYQAEAELRNLKVQKISVAPVCIDFAQLNSEFEQADDFELKKKWGYDADDKLILFVGRMESDKRPVDAVKLFACIHDPKCKLIMVGSGYLLDHVKQEIKSAGVQNRVRIIEKIPNKDIWELYCISDKLINLNHSEIWGMVLMEAMYYGVGIIATDAPGPHCIIENKKSGYLVSDDYEMLLRMQEDFPEEILHNAKDRVTQEFNWARSASVMLTPVQEEV